MTDILEALKISGKTAGNAFIEDRLKNVHKDVNMGKKVAFSINRHTYDIFPPHVLKMIQVGEDAGAMDDMGDMGAGGVGTPAQVLQLLLTRLQASAAATQVATSTLR